MLTGRSSNGFAFSVLLVSYPEVAFSALSLGQAGEKSCETDALQCLEYVGSIQDAIGHIYY